MLLGVSAACRARARPDVRIPRWSVWRSRCSRVRRPAPGRTCTHRAASC